MGMLMWYNEPGLSETIILDPIAYFVKPVTRVICHEDVRKSAVHEVCHKKRRKEYDVLFGTGVASPEILKNMLGYEGCDADALTLLMLKYGLAMCWLTAEDGGAGRVAKYFIPPLFPEAPKSSALKEWSNVSTIRTIYFILSLSDSFGEDAVRENELSSLGSYRRVSLTGCCVPPWNGATSCRISLLMLSITRLNLRFVGRLPS
jgi:hypothetical protein